MCHASDVALWSLPKETTTSHAGQEERWEDGEKNSLQEPPLPPAGTTVVNSKFDREEVFFYSVIYRLNICHLFFHLQQTTPARKPAAPKDDSFFGAFQGLSLDGLMGGTNGSSAVSASAAGGGDPCKVMWADI